MSVLIVAEHDGSALAPATRSCVTAAALLDRELALLVAGHGCAEVAAAAARVAGVGRVLLADATPYAHGLAENLAPLVRGLAAGHSHILAPASTFGKNLLPRVAALLDVAPLSDIVAIEAPDTFCRPIYAGAALATVRSTDPLKVVTVRPTAFDMAPATGGTAVVEALGIPDDADAGVSTFLSEARTEQGRPDLRAANIVVSGGRGMGSAEGFSLLAQLAERLGAAIGASRAAVDAGYVSNDYQVGQTGKVVTPQLYIAIGISGAVQHLAGMKDSKVIVAINHDAEAPIVQLADYAVVDDLFKVIPELCAALTAEAPLP